MEQKIKESVGVLLSHIIKADKRDVEKEAPLFCKIMGQDFECSEAEAKEILDEVMHKTYDLDTHITLINRALCDDKLSKFHLLEQLNHMIYSDEISESDYRFFEDIKKRLFEC